MAANTNMHNLMTLIKRLEAATSRLEDMATAVDPSHSESVAAITAAQSPPPSTKTTVAAASKTLPESVPQSIEAFDAVIEHEIKAFVIAAERIGGLIESQAKAVQQAFDAERTYLLVTTKAKQPEGQPPELMTELHRYVSIVDDYRESNRGSEFFTQLSAISEGIVALGWIVEKKPPDFVSGVLGGAQYYGNKILKEFKDKDKKQTDYMQAYYKVFTALTAYLKEHFPTGLTWNSSGIDAVEALKQIQSGTATPKAGTAVAPGPPPPPPLPNFENDQSSTTVTTNGAQGGDMTAVFSQLNQGSSVTSGLRKVDKSEMTHKNPALRAGASVPQRSGSQTSAGSSSSRGKSPLPSKKPETLRSKKPPRKELDGSKWVVENFDNTGSDVIEIAAELNQSILISRCNKCVIKVSGKANAISIDNCNGLSILVESLVSSLDVIKSPRFQVQLDGVVPTVLLDQVDGATIYLSKEGQATELFTSKCSGVNVVLPPKGDEDDRECPLPEQIRTFIKHGTVVSEIVEHAG